MPHMRRGCANEPSEGAHSSGLRIAQVLGMKTNIAFFTCVTAIAGCSNTATDNSPLEPSRDSRIESLAVAACDRYGDTSSGCPGYGTASSQKYATRSDCTRDFENRAATLWPDNQCSNGRINSVGYKRCEDRTKTYACSTGTENFYDAIAALDECKASAVCTDAAH